MATNEPHRSSETATPGGATAAGGTASAFERPVPPIETPEVTVRPAVKRGRLVSASRSAGHYTGAAVRVYQTTRREGIGEQARNLVRRYPASLAGAAAAGYLLGRILRGR